MPIMKMPGAPKFTLLIALGCDSLNRAGLSKAHRLGKEKTQADDVHRLAKSSKESKLAPKLTSKNFRASFLGPAEWRDYPLH